jgi:hypothetical protein
MRKYLPIIANAYAASSPAEDTTGTIDITIKGELSDGSDTVTVDAMFIEIVRAVS